MTARVAGCMTACRRSRRPRVLPDDGRARPRRR